MRRSSAQDFPRNQSRRWASQRKPVLLFPVGIFFMADLFEHASAPAPGIQLNPEQRAAAHHGEGPLVVVAGAGTGKTRVITERIRYLLETQPELTGNEILGLTFTDKAAAEMKHRVIAAARERGEPAAKRAEAVTLNTFHAFCNALQEEINPELQTMDAAFATWKSPSFRKSLERIAQAIS